MCFCRETASSAATLAIQQGSCDMRAVTSTHLPLPNPEHGCCSWEESSTWAAVQDSREQTEGVVHTEQGVLSQDRQTLGHTKAPAAQRGDAVHAHQMHPCPEKWAPPSRHAASLPQPTDRQQQHYAVLPLAAAASQRPRGFKKESKQKT